MTFRKNDYVMLAIICFFLGIFLIAQFYSGKEYKKVIQPENNSVLALEVAKLTKSNAELREEVKNLTHDLENYKSNAESRKESYDQYMTDSERLDIINGAKEKNGQGVIISIDGKLNTAQIVDVINAIKNMGAEIIAINNTRIVMNTDLSHFSGFSSYEIKVSGNSSLLKSAMERKGGIVEQIQTKDIKFTIKESDNIEIPTGQEINFRYAKVLKDK